MKTAALMTECVFQTTSICLSKQGFILLQHIHVFRHQSGPSWNAVGGQQGIFFFFLSFFFFFQMPDVCKNFQAASYVPFTVKLLVGGGVGEGLDETNTA